MDILGGQNLRERESETQREREKEEELEREDIAVSIIAVSFQLSRRRSQLGSPSIREFPVIT